MHRARNVVSQLSEQTAGLTQNFHQTSRAVVEHASQHAENVDFCSENLIGAVVVCVWSVLIWLLFLPIFHLGVVPWMASWEGMHGLTVLDYMAHAEETYPTPQICFEVLDGNGDKNATLKEFQVGSATFKRPMFRYPAESHPIFEAIDLNKDGVIQEREFYLSTPAGVALKWRVNLTDLKLRAKQAYGYLDSYYQQALDIQSNSKVTEKEWVDAAALLEPPVPAVDAIRLFKEADKDGNRLLEPREWVSYAVYGNFTFSAVIPDTVKFPGPRVTLAVTSALSGALQLIPSDLLEINNIMDAASKPTTSRLLASKNTTEGSTKQIKVSFEILTGTRTRSQLLTTGVAKLPSTSFVTAFKYALTSGGSTTAKPMPTIPPSSIDAGPLTNEDLEQYLNVPAVVQGRSELLLGNEKAATAQVAAKQDQLMPVLAKTFENFAGVKFTVEDGEVEKVQDTSGLSHSNKTMVFHFTADIAKCGEFQKKAWHSGYILAESIRTDIADQHMPELAGVKIHVWTRFTAAYYGSAVAGLKRGPLLNQRLGFYQGYRNDTGTAPFVKEP
jgi:hypothetical protein